MSTKIAATSRPFSKKRSISLLSPLYWLGSKIKRLIDITWGALVAKCVVPARQRSVAFSRSIGGLSAKDRKPFEFSRQAIHLSVDNYFHGMAQVYGIQRDQYDIQHFYLASDDGKSRLDTMQIKPEGWDDLPKNQKTVTLVFHGNSTRYEFDFVQGRLMQYWLDRTHERQDKTRLVLTCNYEDVGFSHRTDGAVTNLKSTLESTMALVKYAVETLGVPPENILGVGHSFGGLVMQYLLKKCHEKGYPIRACIDRTGPAVSDIIVGFVWNAFDKIGLSWLGKILAEICRPFIWVLLKLAGHEIPLGRGLLKVEPKNYYISTLRASAFHRAHHYLEENLAPSQAKGYKLDDDRVIVHSASLWRYMRDKIPAGCRYSRIELKSRIKTLISKLDPETDKDVIYALEGIKAQISKRHKYYYPEHTDDSKVKNADGHGKAQWLLINRYNGAHMLDDFLNFRDGQISTDQAALEAEVDRLWNEHVTAESTAQRIRVSW